MRRKFDGAMSFEEIGKRLGISEKAAQQTFVRAVRKLEKADWSKVREFQSMKNGSGYVYPDWECY